MAGDGRPVGFAGIDGDMLEMLFVAPDLRGTGVGSLLLDRAFARGVRRVDVNEQNPQARGFYEHRPAVSTSTRASGSSAGPNSTARAPPTRSCTWRSSSTAS